MVYTVLAEPQTSSMAGRSSGSLFLLTAGTIHFFFEGYFILNHSHMASRQDFFGQLWKEYALSDSRYLFSDPFVLVMETITAVNPKPVTFPCIQNPLTNSPFLS